MDADTVKFMGFLKRLVEAQEKQTAIFERMEKRLEEMVEELELIKLATEGAGSGSD